jgi:hypothetical protein
MVVPFNGFKQSSNMTTKEKFDHEFKLASNNNARTKIVDKYMSLFIQMWFDSYVKGKHFTEIKDPSKEDIDEFWNTEIKS